jgi:hypothetical protein
MANLIQIKRSLTTATAPSLANGELAFTANGDHLFIGSNGASITIAGKFNPGVLTANQALVANGTSGIDKIITANAVITTLTANGSTGTAGQVLNSNGTVAYWANPASSSFTLAADSGTSDTFNTGETLTFVGGNGLTTTVSNNQITIDATAGTDGGLASNATGLFVVAGSGLVTNSTGVHVGSANGINVQADTVGLTTGSTLTVNSTGAHVNTTLSLTSLSTSGDVQVGGNLTVLGDLLTINVATLAVEDSLIQLASNNTSSDLLDIGFFGSYEAGDAGTHEHTGLFRDASDSGIYKLFVNLEESPTTTVNTAGVGYSIATLEAYLRSGGLVSNSTAVTLTANSSLAVNITANSLSLSTPLAVTSGGIGRASITAGAILVGNGAGATTVLAAATDGYVLQSNGTSVVYGTLDGGTF